MDHEAYENEMIDIVNQHGDTADYKTADPERKQVANKEDARIVVTGLKRTLLALLTAAFFAIAVIGFIAVASKHGYMAVLLFFASVVSLIGAFVFLYAQGIATKIFPESKGDDK